jgi:UDP-N-acetylmuramate: L-alanyl-gamma-D-glutamyl-meso-diaminopimelate ligase
MAQSSINNLKIGAHIHLMGICGTAMASLAGLLKDRGFKVTGSDLNPYPPMSTQIEAMGIQIQRPYKKENLHPQPDFVVVGNVISANNDEAIEMKNLNLPFCSLPQAMGEVIIADRDSFVISGTHGKTTTTSLMSWTAEICGLKPGFLIGGVPKNFSQSFKTPQANTFVIEGDEYDTAYFDKVPKFIHYKPKFVVLTSVEFDHADIYKDFDAVKAAFLMLMKLIPESGALVFWGDDNNVSELASHCSITRKYSYGFNKSNDYVANITSETAEKTTFTLSFKGEKITEYDTPMVGRYNILNATAVVTQAHINKWPQDKIVEALSSFQGVKRRQEILGEYDGVLIIEDFAHHPTAVKETVKAIQNKYSGHKVFSVFEPRSATSRRKVFQKDYVEALGAAHEVLLARPFDQSKISEQDRFSTEELIEDLKKNGKMADAYDSADIIVDNLIQKTKPKDVILIMSNGGFDGIYDKLINKLKARASAK